MAKKHRMTDQEYRVYKTHAYDHPLEVEQGKIHREKANYARCRRKSEARLKRQLRELTGPNDLETWDEDPLVAEYESKATRELRNAKVHKQRLSGLEMHEFCHTDLSPGHGSMQHSQRKSNQTEDLK
jgi:hypothetical protein